MKVKKYTVTIAQLNSGDYTEFNLEFVDAQNYVYYPKALQYINDTNADLQFLYLASDEEKNEITTFPTYFEYLAIPDGSSLADLPRTKYLRIKKASGSASQDLTFYAYNFTTWQR